MTGEIFVDTSAWVALFRPDDTRYRDARNVWNRLVEDRPPLVTTDYVLDETITALLTRVGHSVSVQGGQAILESRGTRLVYLDEAAIRTSWDRYRQFTDKGWSFTDVTSFVIMEQLGVRRAFTFDRHFAQAGFDILGL